MYVSTLLQEHLIITLILIQFLPNFPEFDTTQSVVKLQFKKSLFRSSVSSLQRWPCIEAIKDCLTLKVIFHWRLSSIKCCLYQRSSSIKVYHPLKIVFNWRSSSIEGCLSSMDVFNWKSSSIEGRLSSKVISHCRSSSIKGRLPLNFIFHQRLSSIEGCL